MTTPQLLAAAASTRTERQVRAASPLNVARAKDRETMAARLVEIAERAGATITRDPDMTRDRVIWLDVTGPQGLCVTIDLDGDDRQQGEGVFVLAWHITSDSDAKLTPAFGYVAGGSVNPFHFHKCTAVNYGFAAMCGAVEGALELARTGEAFQ